MRFSTLGSAAYGYGSVAIDGSVPAALSTFGAGILYGPAWLSTTKVLYQNNGVGGFGPSITESYDTGTLARATVDGAGANQICAGANNWATWLAGRGVKTNIGALGTIADVTFGDVSTDHGELALWTHPQTGTGVKVYNATGTAVLFEDEAALIVGPPSVPFRIRGHILVYFTTTGWQYQNVAGGSNLFAPRINESIGWITPVVTASGTQLVLERSTRLTLRYSAKPDGWEIAPNGTFTENPDVMEISAGVIRIGWCANAGETADSLHIVDLTLATGAQRIGTVMAGAVVYTDGPVLEKQKFAVGPVQGSGAGGRLLTPRQHPVTSKSTNDRVTDVWGKFFDQQTKGLSANTAAIAALPPPIPPPGGFGIITAGTGTPVDATVPDDTLTLASADASVTLTTNPATKTVNLSTLNTATDPLADVLMLMGAGGKKTSAVTEIDPFLLMGG